MLRVTRGEALLLRLYDSIRPDIGKSFEALAIARRLSYDWRPFRGV